MDLAKLIAGIKYKIMNTDKLNNNYKLKLAQDNSNSDLSGLLCFCGREIAMSKFKVDDRVVYDGLIAIIERVDKVAGTNRDLYSLVAEEDEEMTCSVTEEKIETYDKQELDQENKLAEARFESTVAMLMVDKLTDKYIGDCSPQ